MAAFPSIFKSNIFPMYARSQQVVSVAFFRNSAQTVEGFSILYVEHVFIRDSRQ
jgi:hypothetical protein